MFCDLVASTALSARLDPEDERAIIGAYPLAHARDTGRASAGLPRRQLRPPTARTHSLLTDERRRLYLQSLTFSRPRPQVLNLRSKVDIFRTTLI
jgi:hypothetical protein